MNLRCRMPPVFAGIFIGDMMLFLAGRWIGRGA